MYTICLPKDYNDHRTSKSLFKLDENFILALVVDGTTIFPRGKGGEITQYYVLVRATGRVN